MNYRIIAIQIGDLIKYDTTLGKIDRAAQSVLACEYEERSQESISSERAQRFYDWVISLSESDIPEEEKEPQLGSFVRLVVPDSLKKESQDILDAAGYSSDDVSDQADEFVQREFHPSIQKHCKKLFQEGNYFHAVFEAAKVYDRKVQEKSEIDDYGSTLMMNAWKHDGGQLSLPSTSNDETDENVSEGMKFLSSGLMRALRNPTSHEPALDWPVDRKDCLDLLGFISYLFRQLDSAKKTN